MILLEKRDGATFAARLRLMQRRLFKCTILLSLLVALISGAGPSSTPPTERASKEAQAKTSATVAKRWVNKFCSELAKTKKISFVKELISNLEQLDPNERLTEPACGKWFFRNMIQTSGQPCLDKANSILELKPILKEGRNVCSKEHADLMEDYHKRFIKSSPANIIVSVVGTRPITENFFMLYVEQVSHTCKKSMLKTLAQMQGSGVVTNEDFEKALPWLREPDICPNNGPSDETHKTRERSAMQKSVDSCQAMSVISGIQNIGQLAVLLKSPDAALVMNKLGDAGKTDPEENVQADDDRTGLIIVVPPEKMEMIQDQATACLKFKPIYDQIVLPVVRLAQMGASIEFKEFDRACGKPLMKRWLGLTLVCETILKSRLSEINDEYKKLLGDSRQEHDIFIVYDECDDKQSDCSVLEERFALQEGPNLEPLSHLTNTLNDELWIHKYRATTLQRFKENMNLFHFDDVKSHIVFVQKTAHVKRWVGRGLVTALMTAAINSL